MIFKLKDFNEIRAQEEKRDENREMEFARNLARKVTERGYDLNSSPESYKTIFRWIAQYCLSIHDNALPPQKGLLICGNPGTGKTVAAKFISHFCQIQMYTMKALDEEWAKGPEGCKYDYDMAFDWKSPVIIDDLGTEPRSKHYGTAPCVDYLLPKLYENWSYTGKPVVITTNLVLSDKPDMKQSIFAVYGERIYSRFSEMFTTVTMTGADRRAVK